MLCALSCSLPRRAHRLADGNPHARRRGARLPVATPARDAAPLAGAPAGADRHPLRAAGHAGSDQELVLPSRGSPRRAEVQPGTAAAGGSPTSVPACEQWKRSLSSGRVRDASRRPTIVSTPSAPRPNAKILDNQWLGMLLETGSVGFFGWLWLFTRVIRRFGAEAKRDESDRGWLLASITAGVAAYAVGMLTFDAFASSRSRSCSSSSSGWAGPAGRAADAARRPDGECRTGRCRS